MSCCSSISEEIETCSVQSEISASDNTFDSRPQAENDGESLSQTLSITSDHKSSFASTFQDTTPTHDVCVESCTHVHTHQENSDDCCNAPPQSNDSPVHASPQALAHNTPGVDFYSKKLAVLKLKETEATPHEGEDGSCHGNHTTTKHVHVTDDCGHALLMQRLETNRAARDKVTTPPVTVAATMQPEGLLRGQTERLRLEAVKHRMMQMIEDTAKDLGREDQCDDICSECKAQLRLLAEKEFVSHKLKVVTEPSFTKRLEENLYQKDSITLLGEVVRSCIRPSATGQTIWQALADRLETLQQEQSKPSQDI